MTHPAIEMNKISKAFGLFFLLGVLGQVVSSTPALPNVVIIYVDDMGYGDLGVQNPDSLIPTPHLDQLAREELGQRFDLLKEYPEKAAQLREILHQARSKRN